MTSLPTNSADTGASEKKSRGNPRCNNPEHIASRYIGVDGFDRCRECKKEYNRKYRATHPNKQKKVNEYVEMWRKKHPERRNAQISANHHKAEIKKSSCEECGKTGYLEMHHPDYAKPLEVITLCKLHHERKHHAVAV